MKHYLTSFWQAIKALGMSQGLDYANAIAYTTLVSLFPFLIFLSAIAGFLGNADTAEKVVQYGFVYLPSNVVETLEPIVREVLTKQTPSLLTIGAIATLWTASSSIETLRTALNDAYSLKETRPFWKRKLQTLLLVLTSGLGLIAVFIFIIAGPLITALSKYFLDIAPYAIWIWNIVRYLAGFSALLLMVAILYRILPNTEQSWRQVLPGAITGGIIWIGSATAFTWLLSLMTDYSKTYGSLGGVITTLLFFQLSATIFLLGAEYNACLEGRREN